MTEKPNHPRLLNTVAHGQMNSSSMSKIMKKMAMVENLMAKRPSGSANWSLPHSKGSILIGEYRRGAMSRGMPRSALATSAEMANSIRMGTYSIMFRGGASAAPPPSLPTDLERSRA